MTTIDDLYDALKSDLRGINSRAFRSALQGFDESSLSHSRRRRQLTLRRLRFDGDKSADLAFYPGVNVLRAGNDKGKSSVLKLIHFCLTGKSDLKKDVDAWIHRAQLSFEIDGQAHAITVDKRRRPHGVLVSGQLPTEGPIPGLEVLRSSPDVDVLLEFKNGKEMQLKLEAFFNEAFGLRPLMGTQKDSRKGSDALLDVATSYRAYMRGMYINQDLGYTDLVTEGTRYGNLYTKIVGMLLGVHGIEPLFSVEARLAHVENALGKEARYHRRVEKSLGIRDLATLDEEIKKLERYIDGLKVDKTALFVRSTSGNLDRRLSDLTEQLVNLDAARQQMAQRMHGLQVDLEASHGSIVELEAAIQSHSTFGALQPHRCPVCEIAFEQRQRHPQVESGQCVLCHEDIPQDDAAKSVAVAEQRLTEAQQVRTKQRRGLEVRRAELEEIEFKAQQLEQQKRHLQTQLRSAHQGTEELEREIELETRYLGRLEAERESADRIVSDDDGDSNLKKLGQQKRILNAVLRHLRTLYADVNERLKQQFALRVRQYCTTIGFPGLEDITLDAQLRPRIQQNGKVYRFAELSPGEKVRFVLAFYLAMAIATGEELEYGAHPGMLLIDSPGKEEMVAKDFSAIVDLLQLAENRYADTIQVIVATTFPAIASATAPHKQTFVANDEDPLF